MEIDEKREVAPLLRLLFFCRGYESWISKKQEQDFGFSKARKLKTSQ